jgi:hypothetical protein
LGIEEAIPVAELLDHVVSLSTNHVVLALEAVWGGRFLFILAGLAVRGI